jgi:hypothetical protein
MYIISQQMNASSSKLHKSLLKCHSPTTHSDPQYPLHLLLSQIIAIYNYHHHHHQNPITSLSQNQSFLHIENLEFPSDKNSLSTNANANANTYIH